MGLKPPKTLTKPYKYPSSLKTDEGDKKREISIKKHKCRSPRA